MMMNELSDLLSVREAALKLHYCQKTVYDLVRKNELESYRIGKGGRTIRIPATAITRILAVNKQGATE
jgi:excisionase family DNA binding protein